MMILSPSLTATITGDTEKLIRELREGKIDGLLGVNAVPASDLTVEPYSMKKYS